MELYSRVSAGYQQSSSWGKRASVLYWLGHDHKPGELSHCAAGQLRVHKEDIILALILHFIVSLNTTVTGFYTRILYPGWTPTGVAAMALTSSPQDSGQSAPWLSVKLLHHHIPFLCPMIRHTHLHRLLVFQNEFISCKSETKQLQDGMRVNTG